MKKSKLIIGLYCTTLFLGNIQAFATPTDTLAKIQDQQEVIAQESNNASNLKVKISNLNKKIKAKEAEIKEQNAKLKDKQEDIKAREDNIKETMRDMQTNKKTNMGLFDILLSAESFTDVINTYTGAKKITEAKAENLQQTKKAKEEVSKIKEELVSTKSSLEKEKKEAQTLLKQANAKQAEVESLVSSLNSQYSSELAEQEAQAKKAREALAKTVTKTTTSKTTTNTTSTGNSSIVATAYNYLGVPYVYGGASPSGFDCSGFVSYVYSQMGYSLPRMSQSISTVGSYVDVASLQPGDIVCWGGVGSAYHVGIYVGNGSYIHAPVPGDVVKVQSMQYFSPSFGRRL